MKKLKFFPFYIFLILNLKGAELPNTPIIFVHGYEKGVICPLFLDKFKISVFIIEYFIRGFKV